MATTPAATVERLRATALDLVSLVGGADDGALHTAPEPGEWSAATVVAHLADAELVWGVRARLILTTDRPWLASYPEDVWADRFAPLEPDTREALSRWRQLRDANVRVFAACDEADWIREGVHDERGTITLATVATLLVHHDRVHLDQIRAALAAAG